MEKQNVISLLLEKSYSVCPCHLTDLLWEMMQVNACLKSLGKAELRSEEELTALFQDMRFLTHLFKK